MTMSRPSSEEKGATVNSLAWIGNLNRFGEISKPNFHLALDLPSMIEKSHAEVGREGGSLSVSPSTRLLSRHEGKTNSRIKPRVLNCACQTRSANTCCCGGCCPEGHVGLLPGVGDGATQGVLWQKKVWFKIISEKLHESRLIHFRLKYALQGIMSCPYTHPVCIRG